MRTELPEARASRSQHTLSSATDRRAAFERLTERRLDRAYRLAGTILDNDAEAQDAVHDAALQAWTHWEKLRDKDRFDAWFDRIVVNVCRDRLRRRATSGRKVVELARDPKVDLVDKAPLDDALLRAVDSLSPDHRIVVVLRFAEDLEVEEIARRTGVRSGTVKSRLHYALRQLRAAYDAAQRSGGSDR